MTIQCTMCKRINVEGEFRLPWPGELGKNIENCYCPRCAREMLARIQSGEFSRLDAAHCSRHAVIN